MTSAPHNTDSTADAQSGATATEQSVTITITSATTIVSGKDQTALTVSDLAVGMMVSVKVTGDATSGYSLFVRDGRLHHTLNVGGLRTTVSSDQQIAPGRRKYSGRS